MIYLSDYACKKAQILCKTPYSLNLIYYCILGNIWFASSGMITLFLCLLGSRITTCLDDFSFSLIKFYRLRHKHLQVLLEATRIDKLQNNGLNVAMLIYHKRVSDVIFLMHPTITKHRQNKNQERKNQEKK